MKRGREEKSHETSRSLTRLRHGGDINIPLDLTVEILKKLPAKSLLRFQCVSKLWSSIISMRRDFIDSIVARSLTQPPRDAHLLCMHHTAANHNEGFLAFSSSTCPRNTVQLSVLSSFPDEIWHPQYVRGLIFCWSDFRNEASIYNPTTRQSFYLPKSMKTLEMGSCLFGYDPLENQYKVLFVPTYNREQGCQVFTLEDPTATQWRTIQGVGSHCPLFGAVCIDGVVYYRANTSQNADPTSRGSYKLMSFDVRSEKFYHVDAPEILMHYFLCLINYQGKLGFVCFATGMEIWVREDGDHKTQGWSNIFFYEMEGFERWYVSYVSGVTRGGEIVFRNMMYLSKDMLRVLYYDPKQNSIRYVDLEGTYSEERRLLNPIVILTLPDFVENTMRLY